MSTSPHLVAGRNAYAEKRYSDAIQPLSKALFLSKGVAETQLDILDLRCQAYSKLGKLDLALQDARHMVRTDRHQAAGYLRCSQIETLSSNHAAAIKWLEHGLKQVPRRQQGFESRLAKLKELAASHATLSKRQDPVVSMPLDVLHIILSYLKYREIIALLRVSRTWRNLLLTLPPTTTEIDFSGTNKRVSYQACNASLQRLCKYARKLDFNLLSPPAAKAVHSWLSKFPRLETVEVLHLDRTEVRLDTHIRWNSCTKLRSLHVGSGQKLTSVKMNEVIANCQSLEEVSMCVLKEEHDYSPQRTLHTQLRHLRVYGEDHVPFIVGTGFCDKYPNLQSLVLIDGRFITDFLDLSNLQDLRQLKLALRTSYTMEVNLPPSLKEFNCIELSNNHVAYEITKPVTLPHLLSASLQHEWGQRLIDALESASSPPKPQCIRTSGIGKEFWNLKSSQGCRVFEACRELSFQSDDLSDRDSDAFISLFPVVEKLEMEAPCVTGAFIANIVNSRSCRLQQVVLKDCYKISSDISSWLKSKGVQCSVVNSTTNSKSAHHVREIW